MAYLKDALRAGVFARLESVAMTDATAVELDAQYRQLREECGLLDRSKRGKLMISGSEAAEYLQGQLTNDVEALSPGEGHYAALLDRKGHMQADMRVLRTSPEEIWIDTELEALEPARRHLEMYKIGREVAIVDLTAERALLSLIGPRSVEIAGTAALPEHVCEAASINRVECLAVGTANGIDLIAKSADADILRDTLTGAGAVEVGPKAAEVLRIETGTPAGRPPSLQGPPQPPPARARAECPRYGRSEPAPGREGGRQDRQCLHLPRPRAARAGDRPPRGRTWRGAGRR